MSKPSLVLTLPVCLLVVIEASFFYPASCEAAHPAPLSVSLPTAQNDRASSKVERAWNDLEAAKSSFEQLKKQAEEDLIQKYDRMIEQVIDSKKLNVEDRGVIVTGLKEAKEAFESFQEFTPLLPMQYPYYEYITKLRKGYYALRKRYTKTYKLLRPDDDRRVTLLEELNELADEANTWDAFQPGSVWQGFRQDFIPPPRVEFDPNEKKIAKRFRIVQDKAGSVDFTLRVLERQGDRIACEVSQSGGDFRAKAEGTFNGINLYLRITEMRRGPKRMFEYRGEIVGNLGQLSLRGIKINGGYGSGRIGLQRR